MMSLTHVPRAFRPALCAGAGPWGDEDDVRAALEAAADGGRAFDGRGGRGAPPPSSPPPGGAGALLGGPPLRRGTRSRFGSRLPGQGPSGVPSSCRWGQPTGTTDRGIAGSSPGDFQPVKEKNIKINNYFLKNLNLCF